MFCHHRPPVVFTSTGVLTLLLLQGVCVWGDVTISALVGESVELTAGCQGEDVDFTEWSFKKITIAEIIGNKPANYLKGEFEGRLEMYPGNFSLKVSKLTTKDSGEFTFTCTKKNTHQNTKTVQLKVHDGSLMVHIRHNVTLQQQNNSCTVILFCNASGSPDAEFSWSGHLSGNGSSLHFPLSPADGSVTLKCTAVSRKTQNSSTVTVQCGNRTANNSGEPFVGIPPTEWYLYYVAIPACGGLVLFVSIGAAICCLRRHKDDSSEQNTVYADITTDQSKKQISASGPPEMSIYEMVDERAVGNRNNPQTLYDKVNFSRQEVKKDVGPTLSSPYQEVL